MEIIENDEVYFPVKSYENYEVSNKGNLQNKKTGRYLNCKEIFTILLKEDVGNFILENGVWYNYIRVSYKENIILR